MNNNPRIFLSYSWADREAAESIDRNLTRLGIEVVRDVRENSYTSSIRQYMKTIRKTDYALMLLSDSFLRSPNCMFEVLEFLKDEDFTDRLLTLVIGNFKILNFESRIEYISYWEAQYKDIESRAGNLEFQNISEISSHTKMLRNISSAVGEFIDVVADRLTFKYDEQNIDIYPEMLRRIGLNPNLSLLNDLSQLEDELYSCRISDKIYDFNRKRVELLEKLDDPLQQVLALLRRRFLFQLDHHLVDILDNAIENVRKSNEISESLRNVIVHIDSSETGYDAFEEYIREGDEQEIYLAAHLFIKELKKRRDIPSTELINELLTISSTPHKQLIVAALLSEFNLEEYTTTLEDVTKQLIETVEGRYSIEAWVQLSQALRKFSTEKYTTLFILAHYQFLRYRDAEAKPYIYPMLPIHNDIFPTSSHYNILLCKGRKEQLSAIWTISLRGADITHRARRNDAPLVLSNAAKSSFRELTESGLDYKEKWRICNTIVKSNLHELSSWIKEQSIAEDLVRNTVTLHDPVFGTIDEPHCAAFLRAVGYLGQKHLEVGDNEGAEGLHLFLKEQYKKVHFSENRAYVVALTTALGYLGDWRPILSNLEEQEPWFHEAATNVARYWIKNDPGEIERALDWTKNRLESPTLTETVKETLRNIHDTLVVRMQ